MSIGAPPPPLPVDAVLARIHEELDRHTTIVLQAPPGTGKTSRLPPSLLDQPWLGDRRVVVLEPRRVAARSAARRMATERAEALGATIGLRTRDDTRVGPHTRLEVVTEGILTRMLLEDPGLEGIGAVVFDEFHERSIHADTALALLRETMAALRPDLRLVVMSATLDTTRLATRLDTDAVVSVSAEQHPVAITHARPAPGEDLVDATARVTAQVLDDPTHIGDLLVFLPGVAAINRVERRLRDRLRPDDPLLITPLHGSLSSTRQDKALRPDPDGRRKVVLATPIAETSVTIDGVATVIDSGLRRRPVIDPGRGLSGLRTVTASRAAADQRAGRAGRQRPGTCVRLWGANDDTHRPVSEPPEITTADLTSLALDLAVWGAADASTLPWIDEPPPATMATAKTNLVELGALDPEGRLTSHGRTLHALATDPRLAHLLVEAVGLEHTHPGAIMTATAVAAVLSEPDPYRSRARPTDLRLRVDLLTVDTPTGPHDRDAVARARRAMHRLRRRIEPLHEGPVGAADLDLTGLLISLAFPQRIAQRRAHPGHFLMVSGTGVVMDPSDALAREPWIAVAETAGVGPDGRVVLASPVDQADLRGAHRQRFDEVEYGGWHPTRGDVVFERQIRLGAIVVQRRPADRPPPEAVVNALVSGVRHEGLDSLRWDEQSRRLRERIAFAHSIEPDRWPAVDDDTLLTTLESWLAPHLDGAMGRPRLGEIDLRPIMASLLDWRQAGRLDRLVPTHLEVPSGSRIRVDYRAEGGPVLAVRLQEMFGSATSPTVYDDRVPVVVHLLSPAGRPVQVTRDMASFWAGGYAEVRRELRGRYPKHPWPEDPTTARPTSRAAPRRRRP